MNTEESTILKAAKKLQQDVKQLKFISWVLIPLLLSVLALTIRINWLMIQMSPIPSEASQHVRFVLLQSAVFAVIAFITGLAWLAYFVVFILPAARQRLRDRLAQSGIMSRLASGTLDYEGLFRHLPLMRLSSSYITRSQHWEFRFVAANLTWFLDRPRNYWVSAFTQVGAIGLAALITVVLCLLYGLRCFEAFIALLIPAYLPFIYASLIRTMWYEEFSRYLIEHLEA